MTRKHFKALAAIVVTMSKDGLLSIETHKRLVCELGDFCHCENPMFDFNLFNRACGLELKSDNMWQLRENVR